MVILTFVTLILFGSNNSKCQQQRRFVHSSRPTRRPLLYKI